jgi:O-antigen ligase
MKILTRGICLVVFCLPLYLVRFKVFGIPTTVLEILIYALFIFWLVKEFRFCKFKNLLITNYSLLVAIILIFIGVSLATIFSSDLRTSAGIWKAWFVDPILFFIVLISVIKSEEQIKKVLSSLFLSGTAVSIIALGYLILGKLDPVGRLQAFYTSPNYLAMYLAPALIIGLSFLIFRNPKYPFCSAARGRSYNPPIIFKNNDSPLKSQKPYFGFLSGIILLLVILFFAHSYGAWLGIIAAIGLGLFICLFKSSKKLAWAICVLILIILLLLGYFALSQRQASFDARLIIWQKAWEVFKANPIFGIGPGTFGNYLQPHNIFLAFLLQTGFMGFIGFIWLLAWFFKAGIKNRELRIINITLMSVMAYILVHGLVDTTYWKNDLSAVFWIIIGLMAVLKKEP